MLEGVLRMADLTAGEVMVAAPRMDLINIDEAIDACMHQVIDTAHSRFPVFEGERDNIVGILLAKDLLKLQRSPALSLRTLLRPPVFVPESKGLNDLLREFRNTRNHMALVVDEFGRIAGLITIEDVLEQIVGEIEDEFDQDDDAGDIFSLADRTFRVSGDTDVSRVAEAFNITLELDEDTANAPLTVVCEGRASRTREEFGVEFDVKPYQQWAVAARVRCAQPARQGGGIGVEQVAGDDDEVAALQLLIGADDKLGAALGRTGEDKTLGDYISRKSA